MDFTEEVSRMSVAGVKTIRHQLQPHYAQLRSFRTWKQMVGSELYTKIHHEIHRVQSGIEWCNTINQVTEPKRTIRIVSWNIERGINLDGVLHHLKKHPILSSADVLLITEADIGMGRSQNKHVPREMADALRMNYCFSNSYFTLGKGDEGEQNHQEENTTALHGCLILSRFPLDECAVQPLPVIYDAFHHLERRIGQRRALICSVKVLGKKIDFCVAHLDPFSSPKQRAQQLGEVLNNLGGSSADAQVIGGDFNTTTYDLRNHFTLFKNLTTKILKRGIHRAIQDYLTPHETDDRPLFECLEEHGFDFKNCNDLTKGTLFYDLREPGVRKKTTKAMSPLGVKWVERQIKPWGGAVPFRLDWMAVKGAVKPVQKSENGMTAPTVINGLRWDDRRISDHDPLVLDLTL